MHIKSVYISITQFSHLLYSLIAPYAVITYHLLSSSPGAGHDLFKIDSTSGLILTKSYLSESSKGCYDLLIEARNPDEPLLNDNATVDICITDQNQSPQFSQSFYNFSINENIPAGINYTFSTLCILLYAHSLYMCIYIYLIELISGVCGYW